MGVRCLPLFCSALLCVQFSFAIILKRKRKVVKYSYVNNRLKCTKYGIDDLLHTFLYFVHIPRLWQKKNYRINIYLSREMRFPTMWYV